MRKTVLAIILVTAAASAFTALPVLGYSASSGFILGGFILFPLAAPPSVSQLSIDAYYGTAGVIKFQPTLTRAFHGGLFTSTLEYRNVKGKNWFGWGNSTDPDSSATMDFEKRNLVADFSFPAGAGFFFSGGLDVRQSTVFNREESVLWDRLPGQVFNSTWTAGATGGIGFIMQGPLNGEILQSTEGFFQAGDVLYGGVTEKIRVTAKPWNGGEIALGARVHRQFNIENTPLPFASGIGQNTNFRGYSDYRFTGAVWTLYQFEAEHRILSLRDSGGNQLLTMAVAVFAEAGEAAEDFKSLTTAGLHTDFGFGFRLGVQPDAEMRADAAWGDEGMLIQTGFDRSF
jgi:hypothetical protein